MKNSSDFILYTMTDVYNTYREGHGAMIRTWRFADVAACRVVSNPAWCRIFREISCFPLSILGHCSYMYVVSFGKALHPQCFTWLRWKWIPSTTEMAMCMISSMRWNSCKTVYSPWSRNGTRMIKSSDQGVKCKVGWKVLRLDIKTAASTFIFLL